MPQPHHEHDHQRYHDAGSQDQQPREDAVLHVHHGHCSSSMLSATVPADLTDLIMAGQNG